MDTITGISTPVGCGAISIVRLSGENAIRIALHFFSAKSIKVERDIVPNKMYLGVFSAKNFQEKCMLVLFKAPKSYTGEDMVELHLHGGVRLTNNVISELVKKGARPANGGEFTRRAFLNGKVTLSEAEGIIGIINAESEAELNAAYQLMQGALGKKIASITQKLLDVNSIVSAALDYPEEMAEEAYATKPHLIRLKNEIEALISTADTGKYIKNGINVAILGRPNVGKSSLLNAMLEKDRAIVTDIAGTTRDIISESFVYKGIKINVLDTAGIREGVDKIEKIGIQRAIEAGDKADMVIYLIDITMGKSEYDKAILARYADKNLIVAYNKEDLSDKGYIDNASENIIDNTIKSTHFVEHNPKEVGLIKDNTNAIYAEDSLTTEYTTAEHRATQVESNSKEVESNATQIESNATQVESSATMAEHSVLEVESNPKEVRINTKEFEHNAIEKLKSPITESKSHLISAKYNKGITALLDEIVKLAEDRHQYGDILTEERHLDAIRRANQVLEGLLKDFDNLTEDCILIDLNNCYNILMEIEGQGATEKIIDNIFSRFCVGK